MRLNTLVNKIVAPAVALAAIGTGVAKADPTITNGGFEQTTAVNTILTTQATGWTATGLSVLYGPGAADSPNASGLVLWGPANGVNNGLTPTSPNGGNFFAADGDVAAGTISQSVTGLVVGQLYSVRFLMAGAQQMGFNGATTEAWSVSLGNETHSSAVLQNANHGFTGWQSMALNFTATAATETLTFAAVGTPAGTPPIVLLDGVSIASIPEPSSLVLAGLSLAGLGAVGLRRRMKAARA